MRIQARHVFAPTWLLPRIRQMCGNNSSKYFPLFVQVRIQAPHVFTQKNPRECFLHVLVLCWGVLPSACGKPDCPRVAARAEFLVGLRVHSNLDLVGKPTADMSVCGPMENIQKRTSNRIADTQPKFQTNSLKVYKQTYNYEQTGVSENGGS